MPLITYQSPPVNSLAVFLSIDNLRSHVITCAALRLRQLLLVSSKLLGQAKVSDLKMTFMV